MFITSRSTDRKLAVFCAVELSRSGGVITAKTYTSIIYVSNNITTRPANAECTALLV